MTHSAAARIVILIVEDEPLLRLDVVDLIEDAGYEAVQAGNSIQAMKALENRSDIRVIISDIDMPPGIDGIELVALAVQRWPHLKVILLSGNIDKSDARLPLGGTFFSKPYRQSDLLKAVNLLAA